jgi:DNA modification methylase
MGVAARLLGRNFVGVEFNADRARGAQLAIEEIDNYLTR